jgi:hypothetical protein
VLGPAKNIHDVYLLTRLENLGKMRKIGHRCFAEDGLRTGRDGDDAIAKPL